MTAIPLRSDRAAWDSLNHPGIHASDLDEDTPVQHMPEAIDVGQIAVWDGDKWLSFPILPPEYIANANGTLSDATDKINAILVLLQNLTLLGIESS